MTYSDTPTTAYLSGWPFYLTYRVSPTLPRRGGTQPRPVSTSLGRTGQPKPVGAERPSATTVLPHREVDVADCLQASQPAASAPTVLTQTSRSHSGGVVERDTYVSPTARGRRTG